MNAQAYKTTPSAHLVIAVEMVKACAAVAVSPIAAKQTAKLFSVTAAAASPASAAIVSESRVP